MKNKIILLTCLFLVSYSVLAQSEYTHFFEQSSRTNSTGMLILGGWAVANIASGAYGWSKYSGQQKYFHQMNFFWNTVNLSIAGISLYSNFQTDATLLSSTEIIGKHVQTEKILLINTALDLGYMATGVLLTQLSSRSIKRVDLLHGYGKSLILQGGFLLVFDLCLYTILKNQRHNFLNNMNLSFAPDFTVFQLYIPI